MMDNHQLPEQRAQGAAARLTPPWSWLLVQLLRSEPLQSRSLPRVLRFELGSHYLSCAPLPAYDKTTRSCPRRLDAEGS